MTVDEALAMAAEPNTATCATEGNCLECQAFLALAAEVKQLRDIAAVLLVACQVGVAWVAVMTARGAVGAAEDLRQVLDAIAEAEAAGIQSITVCGLPVAQKPPLGEVVKLQ